MNQEIYKPSNDRNYEFQNQHGEHFRLKLKEGQKLLLQDPEEEELKVLTKDMINGIEKENLHKRSKTSE